MKKKQFFSKRENVKRIALAWILMICLLPASCGKAAEENAPDAEPLRIESAEKSYRAEPVEIGLAAGEEIRDIQGEGEEVLCLIGKSVGARYVRADAELSLKEESVEEERFPFAFCDVNGERYTVEIDRQDPLRTAVCVYRGEDTVCETGVPYTGGVSAQILERDGTVYAAVGDRCLVIGGKALFVPEETADGKSREIAGLMSLKTGVFLLLGEKTRQGEETVPTGSWLLPVGPDTKELSPSGMACEALFASSVCSSDGEFGYSVAGGALYKTDGEKWEKLLDLTSAGVESGPGTLRAFAALSGERFLFAYGNGLTLLSPSEEEPQQKQEIVVGILDDSMEYSLQDAVLRFNRDNTRYTVSFRSFAGNQDHLNLALLSGELALVLSEEPEIMRAYARQGLIASLEEAVPSLFKDGYLMSNVVDVCRYKGTCFYLPRSFSVSVLCLGKEYMKDRKGFRDMDEMMDFLLESDPVILRGQYQEMLGLYLLRNGLNEWIDWEKGEAHFDKDSFRKVIEATGRGNADVNQAFRLDESIGCGALREWWISEVPSKLGLLEDDAGKNNKAKVLFRAPVEGYEGAVIHGSGYLAISHVSETQKGAAEFYRYVFTMQENMNNWRYYKIAGQMPVVRSGLEEHLKIKENPEDELTRLIWDFVSGADQPMDDGMVQDVIWSELRPYLAGEITAEKAAEHVQNRVSIYLAEQG